MIRWSIWQRKNQGAQGEGVGEIAYHDSMCVMLFFKDQAAQMTNRHIHREWEKQKPKI